MSTLELLAHKVESLPGALQLEVIDFVDFLLTRDEKQSRNEDKQWSTFSMQNAVRGFEDDPVTYSKSDVTP